MLSRGSLNDVNLRSCPAKLNRSAQEASHHREFPSSRSRRGISPLNGLNYHYIREVAALSRAYTRLCGFYLFANNGALLTGLAARASVYEIISYKRWLYSYPSYFPLPIAIVIDSRYLSKREVNGIGGCANRFLKYILKKKKKN